MIIDGTFEAVGSRKHTVEVAIRDSGAFEKSATVTIEPNGADNLSVQIDGSPEQETSVWLVTFLKAETTDVERGENHGKRLTNHHIVRELEKLADWSGGPTTLSVDSPAPGFGCAILVQRAPGGPIEGAQKCDAVVGS